MSLIKTDALVLKVGDYSESTRLVTLLTPDHGRLRALAKGVRRIRSRDRGALEPFSRVHVTLYLKDPSGLGTLRESAILSTPSALRSDYHRWLLASLVFEVLDRATLPATDLHTLFDLVCAYLDELNATPRPVEATLAVLAALLEWHGFRPDFTCCGVCGGGEPFAGFRVDKCSVVCGRCAGGSHFLSLPPGTLKAFEHLASAGIRGLESLRLSGLQLDQICSLLVALLQYHLEITLTTARMLHV
ncbi:MAG: DNA repair protein RecO [Candidatus Sumerlaeia bacterium]|nr:DNA repair protein RecO [Candidatus Sumerlaeia bacterium]